MYLNTKQEGKILTKPAMSSKARDGATTNDAKREVLGTDPNLVFELRRFARSYVIDLARCERLEEKVDQAFNGQPFHPDRPPTSRKNRLRFNLYLTLQEAIWKRRAFLFRELFRSYGIDPKHPDTMWLLPNPGTKAGVPQSPYKKNQPANNVSQEALDTPMVIELAEWSEQLDEWLKRNRQKDGANNAGSE